MRNSLKEWCETTDISINEIERRANECVENGGFPTLVFISSDLYAELQKQMSSHVRFSGPGVPAFGQAIMSINVSAGSLNVQAVVKLRNFLLIGRKEDFEAFTANGVDPVFWNDQERARIDKAFEDLVILEGKYET